MTAPLRTAMTALAVVSLACSTDRAPAVGAPTPSPGTWKYEVAAGESSEVLRVRGRFPAGIPAECGVDRYADPFLDDLEVRTGQGWQSVRREDQTWDLSACESASCEVRYRYRLADAARSIGDHGYAAFRSGVIVAPPTTWLLHPKDYSGPAKYRFQVTVPGGSSFVSGVHAVPGHEGTFEAPAELLRLAPYSAFGTMRQRVLEVDGARFTVAIADAPLDHLDDDRVLRWLERSLGTVTKYYRRPPTREALLLVLPGGRDHIFGMQLGNGGASILVFLGRGTTESELETDWVAVHELLHLAFPSLSRRYQWLSEGLASYVEGVARVQAGTLEAEEMWGKFVRGMPNGLPAPGDQGLDNTPTWGRTYWGGALFSLVADIELRKRSNNRTALGDALRAILDQGGDTTVRWTLEQTLAVGDRATGATVLRDLHAEWGGKPVDVNLDRLWTDLGVRRTGRRVTFDDSAPLAHIRRGITRAKADDPSP